MQKQKNNWKPVKVLAVIFMVGLFLVLLPKFGTKVKAATATEITSTTTRWSGEMQLTEGDVTISGGVAISGNTTLNILSGKTLTIDPYIVIHSCSKLNITGGGIINVSQIHLEGGTFTLSGGTMTSSDITMNINIGAPQGSFDNKVVVDGGTLNVSSIIFGSFHDCSNEIIVKSGTLNAIGSNSTASFLSTNAYSPISFNGGNGTITVDGGTMTFNGGNSTYGNGGSGIKSPDSNACSINVNGGTLSVSGGDGGTGGYGIEKANITLNGGTLAVSGGLKSNSSRSMCFNQCSVEIASGKNYSVNGSGNYTGSQLNAVIGADTTNVTLAPLPAYSIEITAGYGMTKTNNSGSASQTRVIGAMTDVVYTADDAFFFPENYSVSSVNGVNVTRNSYSQITVSGTPTDDTTITLGAATQKIKPNAPDTVTATNCTTVDNNDGKITGVTTAMEYKKEGARNWTAGTGSDITGLVPGTYYVRLKETESTLASNSQELLIKGVPTISAEDITVTYGDTDKSVSGTVTGSIAGGDMSYAVKSGSEDYIDVHATTGALTIKKVPADGMAYVVVTTAETATAAQGTKEVTVTINKATPVVTAPTAKTLTASGSALELVDAGSTTGGTLKYAVGLDATTVPTSGWDIEIPSKAEAGTYYVWYKVEGDQNWADSDSFEPVKVVIKEQASNTSTDSDPSQSNTGTSTDPAPAPVTPVYTPEPVVEKANEEPKPSIFSRKNKDGSETKIEIVWNADGTTTVINENKQADGTTLVKEETRDAKGNGTLKIEEKDADGNLLSSTEGTIGVNKKGTETIKSTTKNADGSVSEKTQKTYKRDPEADNIKKVTISEKKTDAAGNTETIKTTAFVGVLGDATITEKSTVTYAGTNGITVVSDGSEENGTEESKSGTDKGGSKDAKIVVKEERNYSLSVNGRLKLMSLSTDGEKLTIPESIELDGMTRVVKAIGKNAMKGNKTVKEVVLGENITTICTGAFKNCKNLELIELKGSVKKIYKNAFKGIAENAKFVIAASEEDFERIVELLKMSGVSDTVTFERI